MATLRKRSWVTGLVVLLLAAAVGWWFRPLPVSGPWQAQIVDAETGRPVEGVIVLALWDKRTFAWPHPDRHYHDSSEVVSDKDGRVVIPARVVASRHPFELIIGPRLTIFKPGYGKWRLPGTPAPFSEDPITARERADAERHRFAHDGIVIALPRATTREEREQMLDRIIPDMEVPAERYVRLREAYSQERVSLGYSR